MVREVNVSKSLIVLFEDVFDFFECEIVIVDSIGNILCYNKKYKEMVGNNEAYLSSFDAFLKDKSRDTKGKFGKRNRGIMKISLGGSLKGYYVIIFKDSLKIAGESFQKGLRKQ